MDLLIIILEKTITIYNNKKEIEYVSIDPRQVVLSLKKLDSSMQNNFYGKIVGISENDHNIKLNIDHNKIIKFWNAIGKRIPDFKGAICKGGYSSLYDMTPDGNPILDKSDKVLGLYFAIGFSGHGF